MVKRLIISQAAFADIDRIVAFNNERNQFDAYSRKFIKSLFNRFNKILITPKLARKTNLNNQFLIIWSDFYIFYYIEKDYILISKIYHQKEDISF